MLDMIIIPVLILVFGASGRGNGPTEDRENAQAEGAEAAPIGAWVCGWLEGVSSDTVSVSQGTGVPS